MVLEVHMGSPFGNIEVRGARENNLKTSRAERVGEGSLGMYCHRNGAGVRVVSGCGMKGIVG